MATKRTTKAKIVAVCGNGPFEVEDVAEVQALAQLGARCLAELNAIDVEIASCGEAGAAERSAQAIANLRTERRSLGLLPAPERKDAGS